MLLSNEGPEQEETLAGRKTIIANSGGAEKLQTTLSSEVVEKRTREAALQQLRVEMDHLRVENCKLLDEKAIYLQKIAALQKPQN
eukprot:g29332.t1